MRPLTFELVAPFDVGLEVAALTLVMGIRLLELAPLGRVLVYVCLPWSSCWEWAWWPGCWVFGGEDFSALALAFGLVPILGWLDHPHSSWSMGTLSHQDWASRAHRQAGATPV
jgi:hypothetical protein